jgi:hypothetical protein
MSVVSIDEHLRQQLWAAERFEELGFQREIARHLAAHNADWHKAEKYIEQGCSLAQVLRILL